MNRELEADEMARKSRASRPEEGMILSKIYWVCLVLI